MFEDLPSTTLVVYLKDLSKQAEADKALRRILNCGGAYPGWMGQLISLQAILFRTGQYSGTELLAYLRALQPLRDDPDVWGIEEDPELNQIWIGLSNSTAHARVQQAIASFSVPLAAVTIEVPPLNNGTESFTVLEGSVTTREITGVLGVFSFHIHVRYSNLFAATRYPDQCVSSDPVSFSSYFLHTLEKWDGASWKTVYVPFCTAILLPPRPVAPGATQTDSVPVAASRRLNGQPYWRTARVTGTYRFVGKVYLSTSPNPPFITDLAPTEEQISVPFRIVHRLPF